MAVPQATVDKVAPLVAAKRTTCDEPKYLFLNDYLKSGGYALARSCVGGQRSVEDVIKVMEDSGLRGLGGAGFPSGRKWRIVRAEKGPRLMAVNIDEGEPGTFKDRYYLERDPHRFLEGVVIAAWAVDIAEVYIYLRDEYAGVRAVLEREIAALKVMLPWLPAELEQTERLMGRDFWPYGYEPNVHTLNTFLRYSFEQGLARRKLDPKELFAPSSLDSFKI